MKISKALAHEIVEQHPGIEPSDLDSLRDVVDGATYGELDTFKLDMLTDWVTEIARQKLTV